MNRNSNGKRGFEKKTEIKFCSEYEKLGLEDKWTAKYLSFVFLLFFLLSVQTYLAIEQKAYPHLKPTLN